jgi:hypothetical protein
MLKNDPWQSALDFFVIWKKISDMSASCLENNFRTSLFLTDISSPLTSSRTSWRRFDETEWNLWITYFQVVGIQVCVQIRLACACNSKMDFLVKKDLLTLAFLHSWRFDSSLIVKICSCVNKNDNILRWWNVQLEMFKMQYLHYFLKHTFLTPTHLCIMIPGPNPTTWIYNATGSLARFEKYFFLFDF